LSHVLNKLKEAAMEIAAGKTVSKEGTSNSIA
jgi:hypothetical protein